MAADCHMHMILDGYEWRSAIRRHSENGPDIPWIREILAIYRAQGYTYLRDGGDRWAPVPKLGSFPRSTESATGRLWPPSAGQVTTALSSEKNTRICGISPESLRNTGKTVRTLSRS